MHHHNVKKCAYASPQCKQMRICITTTKTNAHMHHHNVKKCAYASPQRTYTIALAQIHTVTPRAGSSAHCIATADTAAHTRTHTHTRKTHPTHINTHTQHTYTQRTHTHTSGLGPKHGARMLHLHKQRPTDRRSVRGCWPVCRFGEWARCCVFTRKEMPTYVHQGLTGIVQYNPIYKHSFSL